MLKFEERKQQPPLVFMPTAVKHTPTPLPTFPVPHHPMTEQTSSHLGARTVQFSQYWHRYLRSGASFFTVRISRDVT